MSVSIFTAVLASVACLYQPEERPRGANAGVKSLKQLTGSYGFSNGFGPINGLRITSRGGFFFESRSCLGVDDFNLGTVAFADGHLIIKPLKRNVVRNALYLLHLGSVIGSEDGKTLRDDLRQLVALYISGGLPNDFVPVSWGERLYLVAAKDGPAFCNGVNQGRLSPCGWSTSDFYLREGDEDKKVDGLPGVPDEWKIMLLTQPLEGKVTEVLRDGRAKVDLGAEQRAWKGMELWAGPERGDWGVVVEVSAKSCVIESRHRELRFEIGRHVRTMAIESTDATHVRR